MEHLPSLAPDTDLAVLGPGMLLPEIPKRLIRKILK